MCMADGGETCDFGRTLNRRARKAHRCYECNRTIRPGEDYQYFTGSYEGMMFDNKMCPHCQVAKQWLEDNCGGFVFQAIGEDLAEHAREYPPLRFAILRIWAGMRRGWRTFADRDALMPVPTMPASIASLMA